LFATGTTAPFFRAKKSNGFSAQTISCHSMGGVHTDEVIE
jgi:hypothetical protein